MWLFARIVGCVFATFVTLLPTIGAAQVVTYTYAGATLNLVQPAPDNCPPTLGNVTATATLNRSQNPILGSYTLTANGATLQGGLGDNPNSFIFQIAPDGHIVSAQVVAVNGQTGPAVPAAPEEIESFYNVPGRIGDVVYQAFAPSFAALCVYVSSANGVWSSGPSANNLGGPTTPWSPATPPSSPANPPGQPVSNPVFLSCGCREGNPISAATGNKFQVETDFTAAPSTGLGLTRYYNSQDTTSSAFGKNWHSTWHHGLTVNGNMVTVTRADGRQDAFTNNGSGVYTADPDVIDYLNRVPATGAQTGWQVVRADDLVEAYTLAGLLTTITTRAGLVTRLVYSAVNNLTQVTGPFGHTLTFTYDSTGRVVRMTVPDGGSYAYAYSATGNLASVALPSGAQRQYVYENATYPNALTGIIDENGQRFATWSYDAQGRAVTSQHAGGVELTTLTYSSGSTSVTDARGNVHGYVLTTQFGVVKPTAVTGAPVQSAGGMAFTYDGSGFIASSTDWDGNVTTYTHDVRGNETSRIMAAGTAQARTITTAWHPIYNLPTTITDGSRVFSFAYDAKGNLLTRTITAPGTASTWSYTYNSSGQVVTATDPRRNVTTYAYDGMGDLARITNALGQVTQFSSYDSDGRPLTIRDPNGLVTTLAYNFRGEVTSKTEAQWVTTDAYDAVGQLIRLTRPDRSFLSFAYDAAHRLTGITDSLGNRIAYTLDATSNRIAEQVSGSSGGLTWTHSYAYDAVNRLSQATGALGQTTSYSYDPNGNLIVVTDPLANVTGAAYDPLIA